MKQKKGFSMVELITVVAIISVMSTTMFLGFSFFSDVLDKKSAAGVIEDIVQNSSLSLLRGQASEVTLYFYKDFIAAEEVLPGATLGLILTADENCPEGYRVSMSSGSAPAMAFNQDGESVMMQPVIGDNNTFCLSFKNTRDIQHMYLRRQEDVYSNILRFYHFNLDREKLQNNLELVLASGSNNVLRMEGSSVRKTGTVSFGIQAIGGTSELPLIINP